MFDGELPAKEENGIPFYHIMYKVRDIDDRHYLEYRSFFIWNGRNYQQYLRVYPAPRYSEFGSATKTSISSKLLPPRKDDNLVVDPNNQDICYAVMSKKKAGGWDLVVAPGADTAALLMLTAILDDMVGWFA